MSSLLKVVATIFTSFVTPAVVGMASEGAPIGEMPHASGGRFSSASMYNTTGVNLTTEASFERFLENETAIQEMSVAVEGQARRRLNKDGI